MDLPAAGHMGACRHSKGAIVEKGQKRCKAIGDYLNSSFTSPISTIAQNQCGSGLAREYGITSNILLNDTPLSRASPLPHLNRRMA